MPKGDHSLHGCVRWCPICGYVYGGPGVCLRDGQTEAEGVPSQVACRVYKLNIIP